MFLDESGDHSLTVIDDQYPVFVLGGIIADVRYAKDVMDPEIRRFKRELFDNEQLILHTADICRNKNGFEQLKDGAFRDAFYKKLDHLMRSLDYKVVACAIRKQPYLEHYGADAFDPYEQCLRILVERFCYEIGGYGDCGWIVAECRDEKLDTQLMATWAELRKGGTFYLSGDAVSTRIKDLVYREKERNIAGLQIADLVVSPIGRHVIGKEPHEDFRIVESKFRRLDDDNYRGPGLVILP
jgi:hypothetical protein